MDIWRENVDDNLQFVKCERCGKRIKIIKIRSPGRASQDRENMMKHLLLSCIKLNEKQKLLIKGLMRDGMKDEGVIQRLELKELQDAFLIMENNMKRQFPLFENAVKEYANNINNNKHSSAIRIELLGINKRSIIRQISQFSVRESQRQITNTQNSGTDRKDINSNWAAGPSTTKRKRHIEYQKVPPNILLTDCNDKKASFTSKDFSNGYEEGLLSPTCASLKYDSSAFTFEDE